MKSFVGICCFWITGTSLLAIATGFNLFEQLPESQLKVAKASCKFTLNVLKHVESKYTASNIIFSPASIGVILSVLQQGAKKNTAAELQKLLQLTPEESRDGYKNLLSLKRAKNVTFEWGNRCYIKPDFELNDDFLQRVKEGFEVGVEKINFGVPSSQHSANIMNNWIKEITHNQITNLVNPSSISIETVMVMINAIFFKGFWQRPFKKGKTTLDKFEVNSKESVQTYFMLQREKFYSDKDTSLGAKWVQLPFQNDRFSMIFVIPTKRHGLSQFLTKLKGEDLYSIFTNRNVNHVKIRIPKFKLTEKVSLVETMTALGLKDIFTPASDLSGISSTARNLVVSDMIHQATIEIDEKGSTGSASTVVQFLRMRTPTLSFVADQPFLFFIIDNEYKIPLFSGKVVNPTQSNPTQ